MTGGVGGGHRAGINITPMIDVLLVLLILFLVIQPALTKGIDVQVPTLEERDPDEGSPDQIVLHVGEGPTFAINQLPVEEGELVEQIRSIFEERPRKVIFISGAGTVAYGDMVWAMDAIRAAGIEVIGLVPRRGGEPAGQD